MVFRRQSNYNLIKIRNGMVESSLPRGCFINNLTWRRNKLTYSQNRRTLFLRLTRCEELSTTQGTMSILISFQHAWEFIKISKRKGRRSPSLRREAFYRNTFVFSELILIIKNKTENKFWQIDISRYHLMKI